MVHSLRVPWEGTVFHFDLLLEKSVWWIVDVQEMCGSANVSTWHSAPNVPSPTFVPTPPDCTEIQ